MYKQVLERNLLCCCTNVTSGCLFVSDKVKQLCICIMEYSNETNLLGIFTEFRYRSSCS